MSEGFGMGRSYQNRRAYKGQTSTVSGPKKVRTKMGAGTGLGVLKYAAENYQQTGIKRAARVGGAMTPHSQVIKEAYEYEKTRSDRPKKVVAPKVPSIAEKRAAFAAANAPIDKAVKTNISGMGVAGLSKAAPKAMNVTPSRTYTDKEKQINAILATGKKKNGTMKASAQRKIQRIRKK